AVPAYESSGPGFMLLSYGGYALLGYALDKTDFSRVRPAIWTGVWAGVLALNALATHWLVIAADRTMDEKFYFGAGPLVGVQGAVMFLLLKRWDQDSWLHRIRPVRWTIQQFGKHSYNVYLSHALIIWLFTQGDLGFVLSEQTGGSPWVGVSLTTAATL